MVKLYLFLVLFFCVYPILTDDEYCTVKGNCDNSIKKSSNVYSTFDNTIIGSIDRARRAYKPCHFSNCSCFFNVLENDLKPFHGGITKESIDHVKPRGVKYQIINGKLYRDEECMFPARCSGVEHFLNSIRRKLPDIELIINVKDWPQVNKHFTPALPIFSFSKTPDYHDILYPAWSFWDGGPAIKLYPTGIGKWDKFRQVLAKEVKQWPWKKKKSKAFFRGSRTSEERDPLILLSRKKLDLVDAAFTKNQAWKSEKDTLGKPPAEEIALEKHCHYKYLFNFRGVAASFRFKFLFLCKSLVFHVGDEWTEFYYPSLVPWIHYIPVKSKSTESELERLIHFFQRHDEIAMEIAEEGHKMIWHLLTMDNVICYWKNLLTRYHSLLRFKPTLDSNLIDVTK